MPTAEKVWSKENAYALSFRRRPRKCALESVPWESVVCAHALKVLSLKECAESTAEVGSQRLAAIPNALIKVLEGLVCAVDEALRAFLASIEDPGRPRQSLARKTTKAGGRAEEGPVRDACESDAVLFAE